MRILHISDLHIVPGVGEEIYGVDSFASLERVLHQGSSADPDLIVATGDLTERGDTESYLRLQKLLLSIGLPVFVVPGNHDSPRRMASDLCRDRIRFEGVHDQAGWRLIFLDSRVRGEPHGRISADQQAELQRSLRAAPHLHALVALHHTPISPCPSFGCQLLGASEFLAHLSSHPNARVVIAGHSHIAAEARFQELRVVTTPSTCAEAIHEPAGSCPDLVDFWASHRFSQARHGYRILELEPNGAFSSKVHWLANPVAA
jgi:Icc protein